MKCNPTPFQVLEQIEKHRIQIYQFPECDSDEDEEFKKQDAELKVIVLKRFVDSKM